MLFKELRSAELWAIVGESGLVIKPGDGRTEGCGVFYDSPEAAEVDLEHFRDMGFHDGDWRVERVGRLDVGPALAHQPE